MGTLRAFNAPHKGPSPGRRTKGETQVLSKPSNISNSEHSAPPVTSAEWETNQTRIGKSTFASISGGKLPILSTILLSSFTLSPSSRQSRHSFLSICLRERLAYCPSQNRTCGFSASGSSSSLQLPVPDVRRQMRLLHILEESIDFRFILLTGLNRFTLSHCGSRVPLSTLKPNLAAFGSKAEYRLLATLYRVRSLTALYYLHRTGALPRYYYRPYGYELLTITPRRN